LNYSIFSSNKEKISIKSEIFKLKSFDYLSNSRANKILMFNSNICEKYLNDSCFYYDNNTNEYYTSVFFNNERSRYGNQTNRVYLNIHSYYDNDDINKLENNLKKLYAYYYNLTKWIEYSVTSIDENEDLRSKTINMNVSLQINTLGIYKLQFIILPLVN
jgi:hypothetical protein